MDTHKPIAIIISDIHIADNDTLIESIANQAIRKAQEFGVDVIINLGDTFTFSKSQSQRNLKIFEKFLDSLSAHGMTMITIVGNHDKTGRDDIYSFLSPYRHHPSLKLIDTYDVINVGGINLSFLSYFDDPIYMEMVSHVKVLAKNQNALSILFTHKGFDGAKDNDGVTIKSDVSDRIVTSFKRIISGHYHNKSTVGKAVYVGSTHQNNFGEDDDKGCAVIYDDYSIDYIKFEFPIYKTLDLIVDAKTMLESIIAATEKSAKECDYLRVVLRGNKDILSTIERSDIIAAGAYKVVKEYIIKNESSDDMASTAIELHQYDKVSIMNESKQFFVKSGYSNIELGMELLKEGIK